MGNSTESTSSPEDFLLLLEEIYQLSDKGRSEGLSIASEIETIWDKRDIVRDRRTKAFTQSDAIEIGKYNDEDARLSKDLTGAIDRLGSTAEYYRLANEIEMQLNERIWNSTGNPIYVWRTIYSTTYNDQNQIPKWCLQYLNKCSHFFASLPSTSSGDAKEDAAALASLFGFTRPGWSAFYQFEQTNEQKDVYVAYRKLRESGISQRQAISEILEQNGLQDERTLRRKIANLKKIFASPSTAPTAEGKTSV